MRGQSVPVGAILLCSVGLWLAGAARADLMAIWDFGLDASSYTDDVTAENVIGTPMLVLFGGELDVNGKGGVEYTDAEGTYHSPGRAGAWDNVTSDSEWSMTINTTNWQDMVIRWDYNSENDPCDLGPESFDFDYRVGGTGGWLSILTNHSMIRDAAWHEFSYDLGDLTDIENESIVQFRIRDLQRGTESGGFFKIDNIELAGTTSATISVLSPNGGERLIAGCVDVTWDNTGVIENVLIEYSPNTGGQWVVIDTAPNTALYKWEVTDANSTQCLVRVSDADNHNVNDTSDGVFTIYQCALAYDLNCDCFIDLQDFVLLISEWLQCGDPLNPVGNLTGYWTMDDNAANKEVLDSSGNNNPGTAQQNTEDIAATGIIDGALSFNGIDDYIQIADSVPLSPTQEITVCGWFYFNDASESVGLIWKHNYNYALWTQSDSVRFAVWNPSSENSRATFSTLLLGSGWNFIAGVFDGTNSMLYLNGVQAGTIGDDLTGGIRDRAGDLYIGQRPDGIGERYFDGVIDDVKIYGRALTPAEITSLYNLVP